MNPLRWVRWKLVIGLSVAVGALYLLGLNPLARREINKLGAGGGAGARFSVEKVALGLLEGRSSFSAFELATSRKAPASAEDQERVARADEVVCDLGMADLLRRRFAVDELSLKKPLLRIQRRADGTINIGEIGSQEPEEPAGKSTDWVKAIEEWMEKLRRRVEERRKKESDPTGKEPPGKEPPGKEPGVREKRGLRADYEKRVSYPFEKRPRALVRKLSAEALEIQFEDQTGGVRPPPLKNGKLEVLNLSDRPEHLEEPIRLTLSGEIEGALIEVSATIDLRRIEETNLRKNDLLLRVKASGVPLQSVVQAFARDSLDVTFEKGTADLDAEVSLVDLEKLAVRSSGAGRPLFSLHGVEMKARPGSRIAGLDGEQFCRAVNEVGDLEVTDLEITGTLKRPEFKWGKSIQELVLSGGKAVAKKEAAKALEKITGKGTEKAQEVLDKELKGKVPGLKVDLEKALPAGALDSLFPKKKKS